MSNASKYVAELIGTMVLVFMGCGSAVFLGVAVNGGYLAVALTFGLSIIAMAYVIGGISGCHINPAVSFAMLLDKRMATKDFIGYVIAQVIGAILGAILLKIIISFGLVDNTGALGSNGVANVGVFGAFIVEVILTFIFILTILGVTSNEKNSSVAGIVIGLTLTFVHIVGISLTGTSVNPARSIGPAIIAGGESLSVLWVFILAPFVGSFLASIAFKFFTGSNSK